ncbi:hypothetical protein FOZ63_008289, partial [Perkinsus olseni]
PYDTGLCLHELSGAYHCIVTPRKAGTGRFLSVRVDKIDVSRHQALNTSAELVQGPFQIDVLPGSVDPKNCELFNVKETYVAGKYEPALLVLRDNYTNNLLNGTANVVATLNGQSLNSSSNHNGTYTVMLGSPTAGRRVLLTVTVNGHAIKNSANLTVEGVDVVAATVNQNGTRCDIPASYVAGEWVSWKCYPRDYWNNPINETDVHLIAEYSPVFANTTAALRFNGTYESTKSGDYVFNTSLQVVGSYSTVVYVGQPGGLVGEYFRTPGLQSLVALTSDRRHSNAPVFSYTRQEVVDLSWEAVAPFEGMHRDFWSARWTGWILPNATGTYKIYVDADHAVRLTVNHKALVEKWELRDIDGRVIYASGNIFLTQNEPVPVELLYRHTTSSAFVTLSWSGVDFPKHPIPGKYLLAPLNALASDQRTVDVSTGLTWSNSTASGVALSQMSAGMVNTFTLQTVDKFGNTRSAADNPAQGDCWNATVGGGLDTCRLRAFLEETGTSENFVYGNFSYTAGGRYMVAIYPRKAGRWNLRVQVWVDRRSWQDVGDSPFTVVVSPNSVVGSNTLIEGSAQNESFAGRQACFNVTMRDNVLNNVYGILAEGAQDVEDDPPTTNLGSMTKYWGLGKWQYCYVQTTAQVWTGLTVRVRGTNIPLSITVRAAPIEPGSKLSYDFNKNLFLHGTSSNSLTKVQANVSYNITLTARDEYTNIVTGDPTIDVACFAEGPQRLSLNVTSRVDVHGLIPRREQLFVHHAGDNVWQLESKYPQSGSWQVRCEVAKQGGLNAKYWPTRGWAGHPTGEFVEPLMCLDWGQGTVGPSQRADNVSMQWDGYLRVDYACNYTLHAEVDEAAYIWLGDRLVLQADSAGDYEVSQIAMVPGRMSPIQITYWDGDGIARFCLMWSCPARGVSKHVIPRNNLFHSGLELDTLNPSGVVTVYKPPDPVSVFYRASPFSTSAATLVWEPPYDDGNDAIVSYKLERKKDVGGTWTTLSSSLAASTYTYVQTSLDNDVPYSYRLTASSTVVGLAREITVFPCTLPDTPQPPVLTAASSVDPTGSFTFSLVPPITTACGSTTLPPTLGYTLAWNDGMGSAVLRNSVTQATSVNPSVVHISNLTYGRVYKISQSWYTRVGHSALSNVSEFRCCDWVKPGPVSNVQRDFSVTQARDKIAIKWDPPTEVGSTSLVRYRVYYSPGSYESYADTANAGITTLTLFGPFVEVDSPNDIWRFQVVAMNAAGEGPRSTRITLLAADPPNAPVAAEGGWVMSSSNTSIVLKWRAPVDSIVSGYKVWVNSGNNTPVDKLVSDGRNRSSVLSFEYAPTRADGRTSALTSGDLYTFHVQAVNQAGDGVMSEDILAYAASRPGRPGRPRQGTGNTTVNFITVEWDAADDGGKSSNLRYTLERSQMGGAWSTVMTDITTLTYTDVVNIRPYEVYRYRLFAENDVTVGAVLYSQENDLMASPPNAAPIASFVGSSENSISISWATPSSPPTVTGYKVYVNFRLAYDGTGNPATLWYTLTDCTLGEWYDLRVTALSAAGESDQSLTCCVKPCGRRPYKPDPPELASSNLTAITLRWSPPADSGGLPLTGYVVQRAPAGSSVFTTIAAMLANILEYTDAAGVVASTGYRYRVYARNAVNDLTTCDTDEYTDCDGDASGHRTLYACAVPSPPSNISRVSPAWSPTVIGISWFPILNLVDSGGCVITGYRVYANDGLDGLPLQMVYDGRTRANVLEYNLTGLTPGRYYWIAVAAITVAGEGAKTSRVALYAGVPHGKPGRPEYKYDSGSPYIEIALKWTPPTTADSGPIVMWELEHDNGDATASSLSVSIKSCSVLDPSYVIHSLTPSKYYRVRVRAHGPCPQNTTLASYPCPLACTTPGQWSDIETFVTGSLPGDFTIQAEDRLRTATSVTIVWSLCTTASTATCVSSAELPLIGFTAFRDDCNGGDVTTAVNTAVASTATSYAFAGLPTGARCGFRIAANNSRGGKLSTNTIYRAIVGPPAAPPAPTRKNSSMSFIHLNTFVPLDNGGASIRYLRVYRDDPPTTSSISVLIAELSSPYLFDFKDLSVSTGRLYRYQTIAVNSEGVESPRSPVATLVAASPPSQPASVRVVYRSRTALHVVWEQPQDNGGNDLFKFTLYMDSGRGGNRLPVFEGPATHREFDGLEPGLRYTFQVSATNIAGESALSDMATFRTVADPGPPGKPFIVSTDCGAETIEIGWAPPEDDGGCEIEKYAVYEYSTELVELTGSVNTALASSYTITGRNCTAAGGPWLFTVRAKNCEGWSSDSHALYTRNADLP